MNIFRFDNELNIGSNDFQWAINLYWFPKTFELWYDNYLNRFNLCIYVFGFSLDFPRY